MELSAAEAGWEPHIGRFSQLVSLCLSHDHSPVTGHRSPSAASPPHARTPSMKQQHRTLQAVAMLPPAFQWEGFFCCCGLFVLLCAGFHTRQWPLIPLPQNSPACDCLHVHHSATSICTTSQRRYGVPNINAVTPSHTAPACCQDAGSDYRSNHHRPALFPRQCCYGHFNRILLGGDSLPTECL